MTNTFYMVLISDANSEQYPENKAAVFLTKFCNVHAYFCQ